MRDILKFIVFIFIPLLVSSQEIKDTIIISENNSPYFITKDFIVSDTTILIIEKASEIILSDSVSINVFGKLLIKGTRKEPVSLKTKNDSISWGRIIIKSHERTIIRYANFINGAITAYDADIYIANSSFYFYNRRKFDGWPVVFIHNSKTNLINNTFVNYTNRYVGEGVNFIGGTVNCINNTLNFLPDAIEFTRIVNGIIAGNHVINSYDDGIDINASINLNIYNNLIENIEDKGISVGGDQSFGDSIKLGKSKNIIIKNNFIINAKIGISASDSSQIRVIKNIISNTKTAINFYEKPSNDGGANAYFENNITVNNKQDFIILNSSVDNFALLSNSDNKHNLILDSVNKYILTNDTINTKIYYRLNYLDTNKIVSDTAIPTMLINTFPKVIIDDERIISDYEIFNKGNKSNYGKLSIEIRGTSSSAFPKKSYGITISEKQDLLGLPKNKDWVLYGPWYDKSLLRNAVAYSIGNKLDIKSPEFRFVNLVINDENKGLYLLMQKIKRSNNFVDVEKTSKSSTDGGYIFKIDKGTGANKWVGICASDSSEKIVYYTHYPKPKNITQNQKTFLKHYISNFEKNLYKNPVNIDAIDIKSFVDYVIISELMKNFDAYKASVYFYKYKYNYKLFIGPIWDFNISSGNSYIKDFNKVENFTFETDIENKEYIAAWWYNLLSDKGFSDLIKKRWTLLRNGSLHNDNLLKLIKDLNHEIENYSDKEQINFFETWLIDRANWLDSNINNIDIKAKKYQ